MLPLSDEVKVHVVLEADTFGTSLAMKNLTVKLPSVRAELIRASALTTGGAVHRHKDQQHVGGTFKQAITSHSEKYLRSQALRRQRV